MRKVLELERSRYGLHLAETDHGAVPLVRLADLALPLLLRLTGATSSAPQGCTLAGAAELMCDWLEHEEHSGRLALYRLRPGLAELVHREPLPPFSEGWRPGQAVPDGYAWRDGAKPGRAWGSHARTAAASSSIKAEPGGWIVWQGDGPEPARHHGLSLVDELSLRTVFSHRAELFGALDDPDDSEPAASDPSRLAIDRGTADRLKAAEAWLFPNDIVAAQAGAVAEQECRPPPGFEKGSKWRQADYVALLGQYERLKDTHGAEAALQLLHQGWGYPFTGLTKLGAPAKAGPLTQRLTTARKRRSEGQRLRA